MLWVGKESRNWQPNCPAPSLPLQGRAGSEGCIVPREHISQTQQHLCRGHLHGKLQLILHPTSCSCKEKCLHFHLSLCYCLGFFQLWKKSSAML